MLAIHLFLLLSFSPLEELPPVVVPQTETSDVGPSRVAIDPDVSSSAPCDGPPSEACEAALAEAYEGLEATCMRLLVEQTDAHWYAPPELAAPAGMPEWLPYAIFFSVGVAAGAVIGAAL